MFYIYKASTLIKYYPLSQASSSLALNTIARTKTSMMLYLSMLQVLCVGH